MDTVNAQGIESANALCDKFAEAILGNYRESAEMGRHTGCRYCKRTWEYSSEESHNKACPVTDAKAWKSRNE